MNDQLEIALHLSNDKIQFTGKARGNPEIIMDYFPPVGNGEGYTGLELLLMSLSGCSATSIVGILKKMNKNVIAFHAGARGIRRTTHPTSFERIFLSFHLTSDNTADADIEKAIEMSEDTICPVWNMLKNSVEIITVYEIHKI